MTREAVGHLLTATGYRELTMQYGHPLADRVGRVAEHRRVLYDAIGPGPHPCHWGCGKVLGWGGVSGLNADHLDGDRLNNALDNLVPSCGPCNRWGKRLGQDRPNGHALKVRCPRGHPLEEPNLVPSLMKLSRRGCLACSRAWSNVRNHPDLDWQTEADRHYREIMSRG